MKKLFFTILTVALALSSSAQMRKTPLTFPDADGMKVLKGDFHIHTIFSDGAVWPVTRIEEAYEEDLDVIALTEHIEYRPKLGDLTSRDHNRSYQLAKEAATRYGIILIPSTEITRMMPPGHLNVIGIKDANAFETYVNPKDTRDSSKVSSALKEARNQGGFIFWNHPAYPTPDNRSTWHPKHQELYNAGLMMGIEVVNGERYEPAAFGWCLEKDLTILSNTDVHSTMAQKRSADGFKVMTLLLANERSEKGVMEALRNKRTVALWNNQLIGRQRDVEPIVKAAIEARLSVRGNNLMLLEFINTSGIPYKMEFGALPSGFRVRNDVPFSIHANGISTFQIHCKEQLPASLSVKVLNTWITPDKNLEFNIPLTIVKQ